MSDDEPMERVTFRCPDDLLAGLDDVADAEETSRSAVIREAVRAHEPVQGVRRRQDRADRLGDPDWVRADGGHDVVWYACQSYADTFHLDADCRLLQKADSVRAVRPEAIPHREPCPVCDPAQSTGEHGERSGLAHKLRQTTPAEVGLDD